MLEIAAHLLEAAPDDLEIVDGAVSVARHAGRATSVADGRRAARLPQPGRAARRAWSLGLEATARYRRAPPFTWSNVVPRVPGRGRPATRAAVTILRYVVSEDCGVMINPTVVEGQIAGGVVQGIGGVLYEHMVYDDDGNPLATTFLDYLLPTAAEVPIIEYGHIETPAGTNPGGLQGDGRGRRDRLAARPSSTPSPTPSPTSAPA